MLFDALLQGILLFFAIIGLLEFGYVIYNLCFSHTIKSKVWIVVKPEKDEAVESVIRSLKSCMDGSLVKTSETGIIILDKSTESELVAENCKSFAYVECCDAHELCELIENEE